MVNKVPPTEAHKAPGGSCVDVESVDTDRDEHCVSGIWSLGMRKAQKNNRSSCNLDQDSRCRPPLPRDEEELVHFAAVYFVDKRRAEATTGTVARASVWVVVL